MGGRGALPTPCLQGRREAHPTSARTEHLSSHMHRSPHPCETSRLPAPRRSRPDASGCRGEPFCSLAYRSASLASPHPASVFFFLTLDVGQKKQQLMGEAQTTRAPTPLPSPATPLPSAAWGLGTLLVLHPHLCSRAGANVAQDAQGPLGCALVQGLPAHPPLGNPPYPPDTRRGLMAPQGCPQCPPYPTGRAPASLLGTPCKLFTRRIPHPSHSTPRLKGSPGPSALVTCPSCRKSTHSSSRHHKTPHVLMILFPRPPHHQQPARQTQRLLALPPTFAAGQPGMLGAAQKKKKKKRGN